MGLFGSLFTKEKEFPPLPAGDPAAALLERHVKAFEEFAGKTSDKLELIPTESTLYVFVGKPPDAFGVVWLRDGKQINLKSLMAEHGLPQPRVQILSDNLRESYVKHRDDPRYAATVAGRKVTVTPSEVFARDVERVIAAV
jgi:hypothetical protein